MAIGTLTLLAAIALPPGMPAGPATLVADLGSEVDRSWEELVASPSWTELGGIVYFFHDDGIHGRELWRSDGTALGTFLVRDLCPGSCHGIPTGLPATGSLGVALGHLFFAGDDGVHGAELWISDGTNLGTRMVVDIHPGLGASEPWLMREVAGQLVFAADDGVHGREVWRSDGTAKGTFLLADLQPGPLGGIVDIEPGPGLVWVITSSEQLWRVDGTVAGTVALGPATAQIGAVMPRRALAALGARVVFVAADGLWGSDGTPAGTELLLAGASPQRGLRHLGELVYLPLQAGGGTQLWRSDGTAAGTEQVVLDAPVVFGPAPEGPFVELPDGTLVFLGHSSETGTELASLPGGSGPLEILELAEGPTSAFDEIGVLLGFAAWRQTPNGLVFVADDGELGNQLWRTDGTAAGTVALPELVPEEPGILVPRLSTTHLSSRSTGPLRLIISRPEANRLAHSDGTSAGTGFVATVGSQTSSWPRSFPTGCQGASGARLFVGSASWWSSPSALLALTPAAGGVDAIELLGLGPQQGLQLRCGAVGARVVILAPGAGSDPATLWVSDGTPTGTVEVGEVARGDLLASRGEDVIWAGDGSVWRSDGTSAGTGPIGAFAGGERQAVLTSAGDVVFPGAFGSTLVRGTVIHALPALERTVAVVSLGQGALALAPDDTPRRSWMVIEGDPPLVRPLLPEGSAGPGVPRASMPSIWPADVSRLGAPLDAHRAVVLLDDGVHGAEPWVTDGSAGGTALLADLRPGPLGSAPIDLVQVRDGLVAFVADDGVHGRELWVSDGTPSGTEVLDLLPGPGSSLPQQLTAIDGVLVFSAWTPSHGRETWWSDGTLAGTGRISDVAPGPKSSSPERFGRAGRRLYFLATDHVLGFEWWSLDVPAWAGLFADGFESGDTSAWSGAVP